MNNSQKKSRLILYSIVIFCFFSSVLYSKPAISETSLNKRNSAVISGKVTAGGDTVANVSVGLFKAVADWNSKPVMQSKADTDGKFLFKNVPPGAYFLYPEAPAFVLEGGKYYTTSSREGIPVVIEGGEKVENIEITMIRGAVITGRLTDPEGKPVISERVLIQIFDDKGEKVRARYDWQSGQGLTD